jgi:hypothetical protein
MLLFGLEGFVSLVGEVDELHSGHVPGLRALTSPKTLGRRDEVWLSIPIVCSCEGFVDERLGDCSDGTVEYTLHHRLVSEPYQTASVLSTVLVLLAKQSVSKCRLASSSPRSRSC